jgi:hypothetical protein
MNSNTRQYLLALIFIGVAIYQCVIKDYLEFALYLVAGLSFGLNALTLEDRFVAYKKPLVIATWIFIASTGILFLYLIQFKYL